MRRPDWLTPAHADAALFLAACFLGGALAGICGALVDRRLRHA